VDRVRRGRRRRSGRGQSAHAIGDRGDFQDGVYLNGDPLQLPAGLKLLNERP